MALGEHVVADYRSVGLSLKAHPLRALRARFARDAIQSCAEAPGMRDGARVRVAGLVLVRQRPGNGNVVFATIEDETGIANVVIWQSLQAQFRREIISAALLLINGRLQRTTEGIVHVIADSLEDRSAELRQAEEAEMISVPLARADELPPPKLPISLTKSRDFH